MKVYDILRLHPEWIADPKAHRAEIGDFAHTYIWELFKMDAQIRDNVLWHDLNKILEVKMGINTFCGLDVEKEEITENQAKADRNKIAILERLVKAICWQLTDYSYCLQHSDIERFYLENEDELGFIDIENWPMAEIGQDVFAGLQPKIKAKSQWKGMKEDNAKELYNNLKNANLIDCNEDDFLWYFSQSKTQERATQTPPDKIKWVPKKCNNFAYFGMMLYKLMGKDRVNWMCLLNIFHTTFTSEQLKSSKNGMSNGMDSYPDKATAIEEALKVLNKDK